MKFLIDNWMLISVAFVSGAMLLWPVVGRGTRVGTVTPSQAVHLMNRERAVVVDVSESNEFAAGHVVGSRNVPLGQLEQRLADAVKNKTVPLILVDGSGAKSQRALAVAKNLGFDKAQALAGGLNAWKEANLPLEKG
jgi:rhodanese-related sulfurtransferase